MHILVRKGNVKNAQKGLKTFWSVTPYTAQGPLCKTLRQKNFKREHRAQGGRTEKAGYAKLPASPFGRYNLRSFRAIVCYDLRFLS
jgi:hypothetical protein